MGRKCNDAPSTLDAQGRALGKITTGGDGRAGLRDAQGRPVDLRRSHILAMCGPDGRPLDPNLTVTIGVGSERRVTTLGAVAEQYFKLSPVEQQARRLLPAIEAPRYQQLETARFGPGDPLAPLEPKLLGVSNLPALLALADPVTLAHGDDREAIRAAMRKDWTHDLVIDRALRDDCRYVVVACPGMSGMRHRNSLSSFEPVCWEETVPGGPGALVVTDPVSSRRSMPTGVATIVIGPADAFTGEQVLDVIPGLPHPPDDHAEAELTKRGYRYGDEIPHVVLRALGIEYVRSGEPGAVMPRPPRALTLPERAEEAARYDAWTRGAELDCRRLGIPGVHPDRELFDPLRRDKVGDPRPMPERIAWVTYADPGDVLEGRAPDGKPCWELDGVQFREDPYDRGLQVWCPELPDPGHQYKEWVPDAGWRTVKSLAELEYRTDLRARAEHRGHMQREPWQYPAPPPAAGDAPAGTAGSGPTPAPTAPAPAPGPTSPSQPSKKRRWRKHKHRDQHEPQAEHQPEERAIPEPCPVEPRSPEPRPAGSEPSRAGKPRLWG